MSMKYLDRKKARRLVREEIASGEAIKSADVVLLRDEYWNTETIYKEGKFVPRSKDGAWECYFGSQWATPALVIYYKDGKEKRTPCYHTNDERAEKEVLRAERQQEEALLRLAALQDRPH